MDTNNNKELTKAEEQVMQAIWKIEKGFANEIVAAVESDVAYNTVLTFLRILEHLLLLPLCSCFEGGIYMLKVLA